jgi:serine/threonine-protein kinase HipA
MSQSALFGLTTKTASQEVLGVIAVVNRWSTHFKGCGVTDADLASLAQRIDGGELLAMRQSFKAVD